MNATMRIINMLTMIPRQPRKISTTQLQAYLDVQGFPIDIRTIQRDLNTLMAHVPLIKDNNKPAGWSWLKDAALFDIPCMDTHTALTFALVESYISKLLPLSTVEYLTPHFEHAHMKLSHSANSDFHNWTKKVRVLPRGQQLQPPHIDPAIMDIVYRALFDETCFAVTYKPRTGTIKEYYVHPLGLVYRNGVGYLVCHLNEHENVVQLVLHRMQTAVLCEHASATSDDFDLETYMQAGHFGFLHGSTAIKLVAHFTVDAAKHLHEVKLSEDQTLLHKKHYTVVKATVNDTEQLRWWLLGFGDKVVVKKPVSLQREIAQTVKKMANNYADI